MGTRDVESKKFRTNGLEPQRLFPAGMLSESCGEIRVKNVRMLTSVDASGDITHHYSVTWSEPGQNAKKAEVKKKEKDKKEDVMGVVPTSVVTTPITTTSSTTASTVSVKKLASQKKIQEGLKRGETLCEGQCNRMVSMANVVQFGCDHIVCDQCRRSQKSAALFDGSPGCCNKECLEKAKADGLQLRPGRNLQSVSSSLSLRSNEGPWEVLNVHVCIVKKVVGHVYKTLLDYEFPSQIRVAELTKTLASYKDTIDDGFSFYSPTKPKEKRDLQPISLNDTNLRFYHLPGYIPLTNGQLYVLIVAKGIQVY